ncbi:MAG TPA: ABC transporter substrate-binding protein [Burkholderiales bacterium]|nr:ABC transporter substrate-binding protein [Burkholderiales bacterium]
MKLKLVTLAFSTALVSLPAHADITIGVSLGVTGPGASLGIDYKNAYQLMPKTLGGEPVKYIILDDASDPTNAAKNARRLISEDKVDALMGSNGVPSAIQMAQVAAEAKTPIIVLTPAVLSPAVLHWSFIVPQSTELMMGAIAQQMKSKGVKTVGYIGFSDTWGDLVLKALQSFAGPDGFKIVTDERYARADTSVTGQVLRIIAANPDAVVVGGSGTGGALPQVALVEHGYKKTIYHSHGDVNGQFIQVGGKAVEGAVAVTGPLIVPEELPAGYPNKAVALEFTRRYEAKFGAGSRNAFAGYAYDGYLLLNAAVPVALKKAQPGTAAFREALRAALEQVHGVVGTHGVYDMNPITHTGLDQRARVLVHVVNGRWRLMK